MNHFPQDTRCPPLCTGNCHQCESCSLLSAACLGYIARMARWPPLAASRAKRDWTFRHFGSSSIIDTGHAMSHHKHHRASLPTGSFLYMLSESPSTSAEVVLSHRRLECAESVTRSVHVLGARLSAETQCMHAKPPLDRSTCQLACRLSQAYPLKRTRSARLAR